MYKREVVVNNRTGLHAGPTSMLVALVSKYKSKTRILYNDIKINPRSVLNLMGAGIPSGSRLLVMAEGEDEQETVTAICDLITELKE